MRNDAYPEALENYQKALDSREPLLSSTKHRIAEAAAIAAYKHKQFSESTEYFGRVLGIGNSKQKAVREYNFANTLAMLAEQALAAQPQPTSEATGSAIKTLETAVTHYDEALRHQPTFPNSETNKQKVLDRIDELKQQQEQQQKQEENEQQEQENQQEKDGEEETEPQSGHQQNEDQQGEQNQQQEGQEGEQEPSSEGEQETQEGEGEQQQEGEGSEQEGDPNDQGEQQDGGDGNEQQDAQEGEGSGDIDDASSQSGGSVDAASVTAAQLAEMNPDERKKTLAEIRELLRSRAKESKDAPLKQSEPSRRVEKNW